MSETVAALIGMGAEVLADDAPDGPYAANAAALHALIELIGLAPILECLHAAAGSAIDAHAETDHESTRLALGKLAAFSDAMATALSTVQE